MSWPLFLGRLGRVGAWGGHEALGVHCAAGSRKVKRAAFGVVELERVGERVEHAVGDGGGVAALQAP